jgi:PAS domain S-box-containing protein
MGALLLFLWHNGRRTSRSAGIGLWALAIWLYGLRQFVVLGLSDSEVSTWERALLFLTRILLSLTIAMGTELFARDRLVQRDYWIVGAASGALLLGGLFLRKDLLVLSVAIPQLFTAIRSIWMLSTHPHLRLTGNLAVAMVCYAIWGASVVPMLLRWGDLSAGAGGFAVQGLGVRQVLTLLILMIVMVFSMVQLYYQQTQNLLTMEHHRTLHAERRFRQAVDHSPVASALIGEDARILLANTRLGSILGKSPPELIGMDCFGFLDEPAGQLAREMHRQRLQGHHGDLQYEIDLRDAKGLQRTFALHSSGYFDEQGKTVTQIQLLDISERKRTQQVLEQHLNSLESTVQAKSLALEQAERLATLGEFSAGMAHDMGNPVSYIRLHARALQKMAMALEPAVDSVRIDRGRLGSVPPDSVMANISASLEAIIEGSERIERLIEDVKKAARSEDEPIRAIVDLVPVVQVACRMCAAVQEKQGVTLKLELCDKALVLGDPGQLEQLIANLVSNACQAMDGDVRQLDIRIAEPENAGISIEILDTGRGIDPAHQELLFNSFFTTRAGEGGTGLGLSISQRIVAEHGGTLTLRPRPAGGVCAQVRLPELRRSEA